MKLGFGSRLVLFIVIALCAYGYLGYAWVSADNEYQAGRTQFDKTMTAMKKISVVPSGLSAKALQLEIERLKGETKAAIQRYPAALEETGMIDRILSYAVTDNVTVRVVANNEDSYKTENYVYPMSTLTLNASGKTSSLLDFLTRLESARLETEAALLPELKVNQVALNQLSTLSEVQITYSTYGRPVPAPPKKTTTPVVKPKAVTGA